MAAKRTKVQVRGRPAVVALEGRGVRVSRRSTGGFYASVALNLELELPGGQRFRGRCDRVMVRVYPLPAPSPEPQPRKRAAAKRSPAKAGVTAPAAGASSPAPS